ncbi:Aste57867_25328 [Aphanomyces stellatus]|uniref:Aste57867_25328 protein n=1 Tax=Aphanomyces stellatus TaxID=120398 RepID=A0A485LTT7_9STRA|nr:hypothetical protein As57867_025250 [Aphanomyces stellatus]VFU01953.1 Aste57867_25328 [Aphanomyces stellatus]
MFNVFEPVETINYNFVSGVYAACTALFLILLAGHHYTDAVEGFYIVFAPFIPCLLWSLVVRQNWLKKEAAIAIDKDAKKND